MADSKKISLIDPSGNTLAELLIADEVESWFNGTVICQNLPIGVKKALAWYDEVVQDQMLSYLDEATTAVQNFELQSKFLDGSAHKVYALHVSPANEVSFRLSPVPPPPELPKVAMRGRADAMPTQNAVGMAPK
jgi:hypothetical protein